MKTLLNEIVVSSLDASKKLEELKVDAAKKELIISVAEREAKVAQELAIADRISSASEVTIEEFYEYKGEGKAGVDLAKSDVGFSGSGQRIAKRIYSFRGFVPDASKA